MTSQKKQGGCCPACIYFDHPVKGQGVYCASADCSCHTAPVGEKCDCEDGFKYPGGHARDCPAYKRLVPVGGEGWCDHEPVSYDVAFWKCKNCGDELDFFSVKEFFGALAKAREEGELSALDFIATNEGWEEREEYYKKIFAARNSH